MLQCELIHSEVEVGRRAGGEFRGFMWKCLVYFPMCVFVRVCVRMRMLSKSIFVCFATSLDIPFGATDRKAVKCDLNILCLHLFPPFSLPPSSLCSLSLPFDFFFLSVDNNIIGSKHVPVLLMACLSLSPHPSQKSKIISSYLYFFV